MRKAITFLALVGAAALFLGGCSTEPTTTQGKTELKNDSRAALDDFKAVDFGLDNLLRSSYGYAIFPSVGKGGAGIGGAYGHGEVYAQGHRVGYADLNQATVGAQLGGQTYSELIVFRTPEAFKRFTDQNLSLAADASAVAIKAGAAADVKWHDDIAVFINVKGGLMAEAVIGGQQFHYVAANDNDNSGTPNAGQGNGTNANNPNNNP